MTFSTQTLQTIQQLVYPLLKGLANIDAQAFVGSQADRLTAVGDALTDLAGLFTLAGSALDDGLLTEEELDSLVAQAKTLPEALEAIISLFKEDEPTEG